MWFLLHTLAQKLEPKYSDHAPFILPLMIKLATNLPCEECSAHARHMLTDLLRNPVRSKSDLIEFWREAHNRVNQRIGKPPFSREECRDKYQRANTHLVVQKYRHMILSAKVGERGMGDAWRRKRALAVLDEYLSSNAYRYLR